MSPSLLISNKVIAEFGPRRDRIVGGAERPLELMSFTQGMKCTPAQTDTAGNGRTVKNETGKS